MKGMVKSIKRTPHMLTSRMGMAAKSSDAEFDEYDRRCTVIEDATDKLLKDSRSFRDGVQGLLSAGSDFGKAFDTIFQPMCVSSPGLSPFTQADAGTNSGSGDYDVDRKNPESQLTLKSISHYQVLMSELKETLAPELDLIDGRVIDPAKELQDLLKRARKTMTKRNHKLVDFDRFNNSLTKLRDKKEKSLSDEKNLFKLEQEWEAASAEYEHYNGLCKTELPRLFQLSTQFITPLFHSFYYMQLNIYYLMLEKLQSFSDGKYDLENGDVEQIYAASQRGATETVDELSKKLLALSSGRFAAAARRREAAGGSGLPAKSEYGSGPKLSPSSTGASLTRSPSSMTAPPPYTAPPPASAASSAYGAAATKRAPPPPPVKPKPKPAVTYVTALYDFAAQADGDLDFRAGDRIELVQRSESAEDWWTGRLNGREGVFPGNYVQE